MKLQDIVNDIVVKSFKAGNKAVKYIGENAGLLYKDTCYGITDVAIENGKAVVKIPFEESTYIVDYALLKQV